MTSDVVFFCVYFCGMGELGSWLVTPVMNQRHGIDQADQVVESATFR